MALGKNLKKKKLIPDKEEKKTVAKSSSKVKKKRLISSGKKAPKRKFSARQVVPKKLVKFIAKEKQERRKSLHERFDLEIKELIDKSVQFIVFKLGAEEFAIEIAKVKEVIVTPEISKVPKMPDYIKGLAAIRGRTVLTIDLALKFGLSASIESNYTLVIDAKNQRVGLLLNELPLALEVEGKNISGTMNYLVETAEEDTYVKGLIKLDERLIYYLDVDELLNSDNKIVVTNQLI